MLFRSCDISNENHLDYKKYSEIMKKLAQQQKLYKYMAMFAGIIAVVVIGQIILANYLQSIY